MRASRQDMRDIGTLYISLDMLSRLRQAQGMEMHWQHKAMWILSKKRMRLSLLTGSVACHPWLDAVTGPAAGLWLTLVADNDATLG